MRVLALLLCLPVGCRYHEFPILGVGGEYAVVTGEIGSWSRYEGCKLGEELQRLKDKVRGAVVEGMLQFNTRLIAEQSAVY